MWLASRLGKGDASDSLSEECYINDTIDNQHFEKTWSWIDPDQARLALEPLGHSLLAHRLSLPYAGG